MHNMKIKGLSDSSSDSKQNQGGQDTKNSLEGTNAQFVVVWDRHGDRRFGKPFLHYNVAASLMNLQEPVTRKNGANLPPGKNS